MQIFKEWWNTHSSTGEIKKEAGLIRSLVVHSSGGSYKTHVLLCTPGSPSGRKQHDSQSYNGLLQPPPAICSYPFSHRIGRTEAANFQNSLLIANVSCHSIQKIIFLNTPFQKSPYWNIASTAYLLAAFCQQEKLIQPENSLIVIVYLIQIDVKISSKKEFLQSVCLLRIISLVRLVHTDLQKLIDPLSSICPIFPTYTFRNCMLRYILPTFC